MYRTQFWAWCTALLQRVTVTRATWYVDGAIAALLFGAPLVPFATAGASKEVFAVGFVGVVVLATCLVIVARGFAPQDETRIVAGGVHAGAFALLLGGFVVFGGFSMQEVWGFAFEQGTLIALIAAVCMGYAGYVYGCTRVSLERFARVSISAIAAAAGMYVLVLVFDPVRITEVQSNAFATFVLFGLMCVYALGVCGVRSYTVGTRIRAAVGVAVLTSAVVLASSNMLLLTTALVGIGALMFAHVTSRGSARPLSIGVALCAAILMAAMGSFGVERFITDTSALTIPQEIRPSLRATMHPGLLAIHDAPYTALTGNGYNSFREVWNTHLPQEVARSPLWDEHFSHGHNFLLTFAIEAGLLLALGVILAIIVSIALLARAAFHPRIETAPFVFVGVAALLWVCIFTPDTLFLVVASFVFGYGFAFGGVSARHDDEDSHTTTYRFTIASAAAVVAIVLIVLAVRHAFALHYYELGVVEIEKETPRYERALELFEQSVAIVPLATTFRTVSETYLAAGRDLFESRGEDMTPEERDRAVALIEESVAMAERARMHGGAGFQSEFALANTRLFLGLVTQDRSQVRTAIEHYSVAEAYAPHHPLPKFLRAQALVVLGEEESARVALIEALELRPHYEDARQLLQVIEASKESAPATSARPSQRQ